MDLGQTIDPTAISVMEITSRREVVDVHFLATPPGPEAPKTWYGQDGRLKEPRRHRSDRRSAPRAFPLRTDYTAQVAYVSSLLRRPPLPPDTALVLDQTGVERPVVNMFQQAGLHPIGVTITGGDSATQSSYRPEEWRVAKLLLVSKLQAALHSGELRIAKALPEARVLVRELQDFRAQFTPTGYARFGAREGQHDDLVLALAIGIWWGSRARSIMTVGSVVYM